MIYFDNAATSLRRPQAVQDAIVHALGHFGNPGRSFHAPAMDAVRAVYYARKAVADLAGGIDPLRVAFTSSVTESLNLVIPSLLSPEDHVITTVLEHNSVLRPLYLLGCGLSVLDCDDSGRLKTELLPSLLRPNTRAVVCTHGSNLLGSITDLAAVKNFCSRHGLLLIVDTAQTLGCIPVLADMADVLCFTGHKSLMGPQGVGGIIARADLPFRLVKTGGSGNLSFEKHQSLLMPDIFEAGTLNVHGLWGLQAGVSFIADTGVETIREKENRLTSRFMEGIAEIPRLRVYGPQAGGDRLPVVSFNLGGIPSDELSLRLWEEFEIATRPGSHCAPLAHKRFGTEAQGMVRVSFGYFNTEREVDDAVGALRQIAEEMR